MLDEFKRTISVDEQGVSTKLKELTSRRSMSCIASNVLRNRPTFRALSHTATSGLSYKSHRHRYQKDSPNNDDRIKEQRIMARSGSPDTTEGQAQS